MRWEKARDEHARTWRWTWYPNEGISSDWPDPHLCWGRRLQKRMASKGDWRPEESKGGGKAGDQKGKGPEVTPPRYQQGAASSSSGRWEDRRQWDDRRWSGDWNRGRQQDDWRAHGWRDYDNQGGWRGYRDGGQGDRGGGWRR